MNQTWNAVSQKWGKLLMAAGCVLFFAYIGWCAPLESDDLGFAALHYETLREYWSYICQYGNGRFLGNALSIAVAHVPWLWVWGRALILAGCVFLLPKVLGMTSRLADALSFLLLVAVDGSLFGQVYAWGSGFANYIPPVFLTLVILKLLPAGKRPWGGGTYVRPPYSCWRFAHSCSWNILRR